MIWVTGSEGMLGKELCETLAELSIPHIGTDREVDVTNYPVTHAFLSNITCSAIVNCAAYTDVGNAEINIQDAYRLNVTAPEILAKLAKTRNIPLFHFSTDYVFDGSLYTRYLEDDPISPLNVYGATKALGEMAVRRIWEKHIIIRTAWLYGKYGKNFVKTIIKNLVLGKNFTVVDDQFGSPTHTSVLIHAIVYFLLLKNFNYGTYHLTNTGKTSWYEFALAIQKYGGWSESLNIKPGKTNDQMVKRPREVDLSKYKISQELDLRIDPWEVELERFLKSYFEKGNLNGRIFES
jgi:dTDP-4-dehydrorhamnose reductase